MRASRPRSLVSLCIAAAALGACASVDHLGVVAFDGAIASDSGTDAGGFDAGAPFDAGVSSTEAICQRLNQVRCEALTRCALIEDDATEFAACLNLLTHTWCGPGTWPAQVAAGVLKVDPVLVKACGDAFSTQTCGAYATLPEACAHFLVPNSGLKAPCFDGFAECTEGVCRGATCPRTCQPAGLADELCSLDADCQSGLYCRLSTTTPGLGQCATYANEAEGCDDNTHCRAGLWCVANSCRSIPTTGQACLLGRCDDLAYCSTQGTCLARLGLGAPCQTGQCQTGFLCSAVTATCLPTVLTKPLAPCTSEQRCPPLMTCVGSTDAGLGLCTTPLAARATCLTNDDCSNELACLATDGGSSVCGARLSNGSKCQSSRACQVDSTCQAGVCRPLPVLGAPCAATRACREGTCIESSLVDGGFVCSPLLGPGSPCSADSQCAANRCSQGSCLTACTP